jgi:hypothetical protein
VKNHVSTILEKLGVDCRAAAVGRGFDLGILAVAIRQLSLALEQFNAANGHYPAGAINLEWNSPRVNMWIQTLPYVEQSSLFGQLDLKFGGGFGGGGNEGAKRQGQSSHARIGQAAYCSPGEEMRNFIHLRGLGSSSQRGCHWMVPGSTI